MSLIIYNGSPEPRWYGVYLNHDESKSFVLRDIKGTINAGGYAILDVSESWVQVIIDTDDPKIYLDPLSADKNENARGYLVTDITTSGANAWIYIGGKRGDWDFRAGGGHKYRVAVKARGGIAFHWTDANFDMSVAIRGKGDGASTSPDSWPANSVVDPVRGQPPKPVGLPARSPASWLQIQGSLKQVSAASASLVWGVNGGDEIYRWEGGDSWTQIPGAAVNVSVAADGTVWCVNREGMIYRCNV